MWLGTLVWCESTKKNGWRQARIHAHAFYGQTLFLWCFDLKQIIKQLEAKSAELGRLRKAQHEAQMFPTCPRRLCVLSRACPSPRSVNMMQKNIYSFSCSCSDRVLMSSSSWRRQWCPWSRSMLLVGSRLTRSWFMELCLLGLCSCLTPLVFVNLWLWYGQKHDCNEVFLFMMYDPRIL